MMLLQVLVGTILVVSKEYTAPRFHMFYGFLAFLTVGLAYQYRQADARARCELFYGLVGLFIMGLGIRAVLQASERGRVVMARRRVLLLFGGRSAEHDVSRATAVAVARALDPERYEVVPVAITTDGRWLLADAARAAIEAGPPSLPAEFPVDGRPAEGLGELSRVRRTSFGARRRRGAAAAPRAVRRGRHRAGTVRARATSPYVGSGVLGSAVAMDKVMMKRAFAAAGLPTPRHVVFRDGHDLDAFVGRGRARASATRAS